MLLLPKHLCRTIRHFHAFWYRRALRWISLAAASAVTLGMLLLYLVPLPQPLMPPISKVVRFADDSLMRVYLAEDERWRIWTPLEDIDSLLVQTTLQYEDRYFRYHFGVNPISMTRALVQNLRAGETLSGGSTLTMQLARLIEPKPRTVTSKLHEMFRAAQYEVRFSKDEILELYLNRAPYGGNYEGVAAASLAYFGKPPEQLFPAEAAYLVSLPQSPTARHPGAGKPHQSLLARNRVLARMQARGLIDTEAIAAALQSPVPRVIHSFPADAPHAADYLRQHFPEVTDIRSTLDPHVQRVAENLLKSHTARLRNLGAHNASVVVMHNASREVRALVGSLDYWNPSHGGQIIGFDIPRSPGSALKPFLYALALQEGVITSETLLEDVPAGFGEFRPANFSGKYRGLVKAELALAQSLNYPFVKLLQQVGYHDFMDLLREADLTPTVAREYGLTLITGGMEVHLLDLTNAYVTLARAGDHQSPALLLESDGSARDTRSILDPGAASLTRRAIALRDRPDAPSERYLAQTKAEVYWKTGTSWGRRDAWSVGSTPDYTVGVWVGNFSAEGADGIVGAPAAAPILFDILAALGSDRRTLPLETDYLIQIRVCALSGLPPSPHCPQTKGVWVVRDHAPRQTCPYHRAFLVEKATGRRVQPWHEYGNGEVEQKVMTVYPPLAAAFMGATSGDASVQLPEHGTQQEKTQLRLARPTNGMSYLITSGIRPAGKIPLQAWTDTADGDIFWFANDRFVIQSNSGSTCFLEPQRGSLRITAMDSAGNLAHAKVRVGAL